MPTVTKVGKEGRPRVALLCSFLAAAGKPGAERPLARGRRVEHLWTEREPEVAAVRHRRERAEGLGDTARRPPAGKLAALARAALSPSIAGSRAELERVTAARIDASLLFLILSARAIHLLQAAIDVTVGSSAYAHPLAAQLAAAGCLAESVMLSFKLVGRGRLTASLLAGDAAWGLAGFALMSYATTSTLGRTGSIDWMLPYTVATATGFGLIAAREDVGLGQRREGRRFDWRGAVATCALAAGYAASVSFPHFVPGERASGVIGNTGNYLVFYVGATAVSIALGRQLRMIAAANDAAKREASQLADEAQWRVVAVDVFGPVLDLLERAAEMDDEVPEPLRHEADRLIELIEATNPGVGAGDHR